MSDDDLKSRVTRHGEDIASLKTTQEELKRQSQKHFDLEKEIFELLGDLKTGLAVNIAADKVRAKEFDGVGPKLDKILLQQTDLIKRIEHLENVSKAYDRIIQAIAFLSNPVVHKIFKKVVIAIVIVTIIFFDDFRAVLSSHAQRIHISQEVPKIKE